MFVLLRIASTRGAFIIRNARFMQLMREMADGSYDEAVGALNKLQCNAMMPIHKKYQGLGLVAMKQFLQRIQVSGGDLDSLNIVHVAGTKGKGSTCAFVESILRQHGVKTGFFSSPHLIEARERIRLNGKPISKALFVKYFWEVRGLLLESKEKFDPEFPSYFYFLTLMSFYIFKHEKVQAAVVEVGIGGTYDCTNVVSKPTVCGIASLGMDHTNILGKTISSIANHKAGIIKPQVAVFTVQQSENGLAVIEKVAAEKGSQLTVAPDFATYSSQSKQEIVLGLSGAYQKINATLAIQVAGFWLQKHRPGTLPISQSCLSEGFLTGLLNCQWNGRAQILKFNSMTFYLDGAHTAESIDCAQNWFQEQSKLEELSLEKSCSKVLVFNVTKKRDSYQLLTQLYPCGFKSVLFVPNIATLLKTDFSDQNNLRTSNKKSLVEVEENLNKWKTLCEVNNANITDSDALVFSCIANVMAWISKNRDDELYERANSLSLESERIVAPIGSDHLQVFITGSMHLVGDCLRILKPDLND